MHCIKLPARVLECSLNRVPARCSPEPDWKCPLRKNPYIGLTIVGPCNSLVRKLKESVQGHGAFRAVQGG